MYNLYQSQLRKDIQQKIYKKPTFTVEIFGKEYFGIIKTKKIGPLKLKRYQIMGVELPSDSEFILSEINKIKKIYGKNLTNISFQIGLLNEIIRFENINHKNDTFKDDLKLIRLNVRKILCSYYGINVAFRENMPQSDIIYDVTKSDEELIKDMNSGCKERVKKAIKNQIEFGVINKDQYEMFYEQWLKLAGGKGFNIIPKEQYYKLIQYFDEEKRGKIFIAQKDGELVAGSICAFDQHRLIYLYGFSNRKFGNIGGHHFLKFKIFGRARENGFTYVDMMGGAPTGFEDHPLASVSAFKESLGGIKIEQYGSYDIVLNHFLYKIFELYTRWRGK